jgi:hypothetical protein
MKINQNLAIAIAAGTFTLAAYGWQAPDKLHEAISEAVTVSCAVVQMLGTKQDPPHDKDGSK